MVKLREQFKTRLTGLSSLAGMIDACFPPSRAELRRPGYCVVTTAQLRHRAVSRSYVLLPYDLHVPPSLPEHSRTPSITLMTHTYAARHDAGLNW
jgi:hypothetical protein